MIGLQPVDRKAAFVISTSRWIPADAGSSATFRNGSPTWIGLRYLLFALAYVVTVVVSLSVVYSGTIIAIVWPSIGIAVWWAVTCRSWRVFAFVCACVFTVPALYLGFFEGTTLRGAILVGFSHLIAGPLIVPLMALFEKMHPTEAQAGDDRFFMPLTRILAPRHVYRLLIASLILIPIAKAITLLAVAGSGNSVSVTLYLSLILRDLAGVIAVAGPGIAISSATLRGFSAATIREFIGVLVVTAVLLAGIFVHGRELPVVYLAMLPLYWSATRLPVPVAVIHAVVTVSLATFFTYLLGGGPFSVANESPVAQATAIQLFVIMCVLLSLVVSTTVQQHSTLLAEFEVLAATIPDGMLVISRSGKAFPINATAHDLVSQTPTGEFFTRRLREVDGELLHDGNRPSGRALRGENVRGMFVELAELDTDGTEADRRFYSVSASPLYLRGETEPGHALLLYHDSTEEYRTMQQLRHARDEARHLFEHAPQGVATLDEQGLIVQANRALGELVGMPATQLPGHRLDEFITEDGLTEEVTMALEAPGALVHADRCLQARDGHSRRVALSFRMMISEDERTAPVLVNAIDVTERQRLHELVSHLADHDSLTSLFNRRRFETELKKIFARDTPDSGDGALMLLDLDNFKMVNDLIGHHAGDELLVEFAELLRDCVRSTDLVGRLGGDEFVVVLPDTTPETATDIGARIIETVHQRFSGRPNAVRHVTASIGIVMFSEAREQGVSPMLLADQLLYEAKHAGRNRFASLKPETGPAPQATQPITRERVERILEKEALTLVLQPIADMESGHIGFAEGLMRIAPGEEPLPTGELVAAVERAGLGPELDMCVLRKGIRLLPELQRISPGFRLALNLSAQSLGSMEVARMVVSELEQQQIPPGSLVLEVTESAPLEDVAAAREFQETLAGHGVALALDDFGAGFDPYRYLRQLDFSILKVAGEFVEGAVEGGVDRSIVTSLVGLAREQGMDTVAEFVSDERTHEVAKACGVTYAQGYHIGKPLPPADFMSTHLL